MKWSGVIMVLGLIATIIIALFSMFIPGLLLAFALLGKTELHTFEIVVTGFIFGLIAPATLTWMESYLINYVHAFSFSLGLFEANVLVLTIIGFALCYWEGVLADFIIFASGLASGMKETSTKGSLDGTRKSLSRYSRGREIVKLHTEEENSLLSKQRSELNAISGMNQAERLKIAESHRESIEHMREDHLKQEIMLLQDLGFSPGEGSPKSTTFKPPRWVWAVLFAIMILTFYTRMQSIVITPKFFEFDPYFDMIDAHYILTYGKQLLLDPSAWPVVAAGTNHRLQPLVPYLEAFWYSLANTLQYHKTAFSTNLMSYIGGVYPPITAALLVFVIFVLLYHEYDHKIGLMGAGLAATMPVLFTTFISGEQLVEPWGIFALFFFLAAYMLAVRNMKDKRLAIFAGIAFASNFLGAHYYTLTAGVLAMYIIIQGIIDVLRNESLMDFYKMNAIVLITIIIFYIIYAPYQATLQSNLSSLIGIPIVIALPLFALIFVVVLDFIPKLFARSKIIIKETNFITNVGFMVLIALLALGTIMFTSIGSSVKSYLDISVRFTTPSKPLFMTVQEYIPTGPSYQFGSQGFGSIGAGIFNVPILIWILCIISITLIAISIAFRRSKTGIFYIAMALPLMAAGFSEVKYLPHFGTVYILLFGISLGEILYLVSSEFYKGLRNREIAMALALSIGIVSLFVGFSLYSFGITAALALGLIFMSLLILLVYFTQLPREHFSIRAIYSEHVFASELVIIVGLYFIFGLMFAVAAIIAILVYRYGIKQTKDRHNLWLVVACIALAFFSYTNIGLFMYGEAGSIMQALSAQALYASNPTNACTLLSNGGNSLGYNTYCNVIPAYWLNSMLWINQNVGPNAPRVLAWWDYGDWINWFGNGNAVLRGDNSVAKEDYAVAAQFVLGSKYNATPSSLANYMNGNQTKYVLFDQDLIQKWGALNFLGCVNVNATSESYAIAQGKSSSPPVPYVLGTSQCELAHDPEFVLLPLTALIQTNQSQQSINNYCSISTAKTTYISGHLILGNNLENATVCVDSTPNTNGVLSVYSTNGTRMNAYIQASNYLGVQRIQGSYYVEFLMIYTPNAPNGVITNSPSQFYSSNYYQGFILGNLPGFKEVYPSNAIGINYVNGTYPVRIYEVANYTGGLPPVPPKPTWITNNDIMP